ncbi:MAG: cytochrome c [Acidobacteriota bacterium]|nr:cytochrome c [Acidobacteriota bacterium]MDH3525707.1 cytochrome c [Acidobacteriota bacterium]
MNARRRSIEVLQRAIAATGALAAVLLLAAPASGQIRDYGESPGFAVASGRVTFQRYCASCHGANALGDGNVAQYLRIPPANLTLLAANSENGEFPEEQVYEYIDGRRPVAGHGTREMPVWGEVFQSTLAMQPTTEEDGETRAGRMIYQLVEYVRSIQVTE